MSAKICLNMIVKNEAANIERCLASVAPAIDAWVICDTGSTDDTIERICSFFARHGIPGELHEFPFANWEQARNAALERARASALRCDYFLFADADMELRIDDQDFRARLSEHAYLLRQQNSISYFNTRLLRRDVEARYVGVTHEYLKLPQPAVRLDGLWFIDHASGSNRAGKFARDARMLEDDLMRNPDNPRSVFYLAQSWRDAGELAKAREIYRRRATMGGWDEEVWYSLYEVAKLTERLGEPDAAVRDAYLTAYQHRPTRAEPLVQLARWHRERHQWALADLFARQAQRIARPADLLFVDEATYRYASDDEAAIAAYWVGDRERSFDLCWKLLDSGQLPDAMRQRVEGNAAFSAETVAAVAAAYPDAIVERLTKRIGVQPDGAVVTLTVTTCKRLELFERTINSFLNCCVDLERIGRFVCIDDNSTAADRARMQKRYPFFEFILKPEADKGHAHSMNRLREQVRTPYWLHLEDDWNFVVRMDYVARGIAILDVEPAVAQVAFNRNYAERYEDRTLAGGLLRRHPDSGKRYVVHEYLASETERQVFFERQPPGTLANTWWPHFTLRPSLMRTEAIRSLGRFDETPGHFELNFAQRFAAAGLQTAFFDSIVCLHIGRLTSERGDATWNAYGLNEVRQF